MFAMMAVAIGRAARGREWEATFGHILRGTSANPIPKGGEAFRGVESDGKGGESKRKWRE